MSEPLPDSQGKDVVPEVLSYAPHQPRRLSWHVRLRVALLITVILVVGVCINTGLRLGVAHEVCVSCGAQATVHHVRLFSMLGRYGRSAHEGPVSRLLQEHEKTTCAHQWNPGTDTSGGPSWVTTGACNGLFGLTVVERLEGRANVGAVLRERMRQDPDFPTKFRKYILQGKNMNPFARELLEEVAGQHVDEG